MTAFRIAYFRKGEKIGSTVISSLEGEVADLALNNLGICFGSNQPDDFTITEGKVVPHPTVKGAVVFTETVK